MSGSKIATALRGENLRMVGKLAVMTALMFGFGFAMVPLYNSICSELGTNVLAIQEQQPDGTTGAAKPNTQIDYGRTVSVEFDANAHGPWSFKPAVNSLQVHPGELNTVMYEFQNTQSRVMSAQAIPSYAPKQATAHFHKLECFCFHEYTLQPGESKRWPVVFVIDPKLPRDVKTITLSYTFFEVSGKGVKQVQAPKLGAAT